MPRPPVNLNITVEYITPEIALEWLENNRHNRRISERLIDKYAASMKNDEWKLNGETIIFDKKGVLQSGQHRLLASIEAMTGFWCVVVRGADSASLYSLDSGRSRRMTDVLHLKGEKDVMVLSSALSWYWRWENQAMDRLGETATHTHLLELLDANPEIRDSMPWARRIKASLDFSPGLITALHYGLRLIDDDDCESWFLKIHEGISLTAKEPAYALRRWAIKAAHEQRRPSQVNIAGIFVKAWNAYREHREVTSLVFKGNEVFPEAI